MSAADEEKTNVEEGQLFSNVKSRKNLYLLGFTFMLCFSSYQGVLELESSINVEEGLGTLSILVIFVISSISCVTVVPTLINFYGAKLSIILGELGMAVYVAANFYPSWYTLMPAAIFHGLTESSVWAGASVYVAYLGDEKWKKRRRKDLDSSKSKKSYIYLYFGRFYSFVYTGAVLGNALISLVLTFFQEPNELPLPQNVTYSMLATTASSVDSVSSLGNAVTSEIDHEKSRLPIEKCGANDCQAEYIYSGSEEELENFNPSPISINILLGIFLALSAIGITMQAFFLVRAPTQYDDQQTNDEDNLIQGGGDHTEGNNKFKNLLAQLRLTLVHIFSPLHLLMAPLIFYYGLYFAFAFTEFTRAYVSCTIGVAQLGIALMISSVSSVGASVAAPKIVILIGWKKFVLFLGLYHIGFYMFCLFWTPTPSNLWIPYLMAVFVGVGEGLIICFTQGIVALYFEERLAIAYSVANLVTNLGIVAATAWSTSLCVYTKIYIQSGFLFFSLALFLAADLLFDRNEKKKKTAQLQCSTENAMTLR